MRLSLEAGQLADRIYLKLAYHAAASHLLKSNATSDDGSDVVLIDTNGSFSPLRLRDVLVYRLRARAQRARGLRQTGYVYEKATRSGQPPESDFTVEATRLLDRVRVMRVFDLAGVAEAVGEVSEIVGRKRRDVREEAPLQTAVTHRRRSGEVGDSEEEIDEDEGDEAHADGVEAGTNAAMDKPEASIGMILIDTITNVISSLVTKNQTQGQALLVSLMRSLRHLTARYFTCTILSNAAVGTNTESRKNLNYEYRGPADNVSVFSSTLGRPALGKTFSYLIDTSVFLSSVPKTKDDAITAFSESGQRRWRNAQVIEVLKDRRGGRDGRWMGFEIAEGTKFVPCE